MRQLKLDGIIATKIQYIKEQHEKNQDENAWDVIKRLKGNARKIAERIMKKKVDQRGRKVVISVRINAVTKTENYHKIKDFINKIFDLTEEKGGFYKEEKF